MMVRVGAMIAAIVHGVSPSIAIVLVAHNVSAKRGRVNQRAVKQPTA
jgi:hypothetical protein